jgi:hypothetical protein
VVSTRLRVNLTRPRVDLTLLRVPLTRRCVRIELVPKALLPCPPTSVRPVLNRCSVGFFVVFFYFLCICVVMYLYFCLFFVGFYLPAVIWFNLEEEIVAGGRPSASLWFYVVLAVQPSFHSGGCFTYIGLFTEFLCILHRLVRPWNRPGLLMILFESLAITIACCLVLLDWIQYLFLYLHYFLLFGFVVACCLVLLDWISEFVFIFALFFTI